jgi:hypothetical protein
MQKCSVVADPFQFVANLAFRNPAFHFETVDIDRAIPTIFQFDMDMGRQMVTCV